MITESTTINPNKRQGRSAVSNGTRMLEGVDGRSAGARRFRDLVEAHCSALGRAYDTLSEAERNTIRQAATCQLQSEGLQARVARGELVDTDQLVRLSNLSMRLLRSLGLGQPGNDGAGDDEPDLHAYLEGASR